MFYLWSMLMLVVMGEWVRFCYLLILVKIIYFGFNVCWEFIFRYVVVYNIVMCILFEVYILVVDNS